MTQFCNLLIDFEAIVLKFAELSAHCPYMKMTTKEAYQKLISTINEVRFASVIDEPNGQVQICELKINENIVHQPQDNPSIKDV